MTDAKAQANEWKLKLFPPFFKLVAVATAARMINAQEQYGEFLKLISGIEADYVSLCEAGRQRELIGRIRGAYDLLSYIDGSAVEGLLVN